AGSRANLLEIYAGPTANSPAYWRNDMAALRLGEGAQLARAVLVEESADALHLAQTDAVLGAGARLSGFALLLKGRRLRHEASLVIDGEGAQCRFDAAYIATGSDEVNIVTAIDHRVPGGHSSELIKGVAADADRRLSARGGGNGRGPRDPYASAAASGAPAGRSGGVRWRQYRCSAPRRGPSGSMAAGCGASSRFSRRIPAWCSSIPAPVRRSRAASSTASRIFIGTTTPMCIAACTR